MTGAAPEDLYQVSITSPPEGAHILRIAFGPQLAGNDVLVRAAADGLRRCRVPGGQLLLVNGPASLPVAATLAHAVGHLYGAVAWWDPKLSSYVVAISHNPNFPLGTLIDEAGDRRP